MYALRVAPAIDANLLFDNIFKFMYALPLILLKIVGKHSRALKILLI